MYVCMYAQNVCMFVCTVCMYVCICTVVYVQYVCMYCMFSRYVSCFNEHLSVLLSSTKTVQAIACGVTLTHLLKAKDQLTQSNGLVDADLSEYLESVDLSYNLILGPTCSASCSREWPEFFSWLACRCRNLQYVNLSYCSGRLG